MKFHSKLISEARFISEIYIFHSVVSHQLCRNRRLSENVRQLYTRYASEQEWVTINRLFLK